MKTSTFEISVSDKVAELTLNRPEKLNTLTREFWTEFRESVEELDRRGDIRALIISSEGKHFTAGMDLEVFASMPDLSNIEPGRARAALMKTVQSFQETFSGLEKTRFPVLAAIQGGCIGGGVDLATACDMRYCTDDAFFVIQEINIGMTADVGTFPRLQKVMSEGMTRELAYTGRKLMAKQALFSGLVNETFSDREAMLEAVRTIASEIASKSPLAVWGSKNILNYGRDHTISDTLQQMATWQAGMWHMPDMHTAMAAAQKRQVPEFEDLLPGKDVI